MRLLRSLCEVVAATERCAPHQAVAFQALADPGNSVLGEILVEDQRICWANSRGSHQLGAKLAELGGLSPHRLGELCRHSLAQGYPTLEGLRGAGGIDEAELEAALRRHVAESLGSLARAIAEGRGRLSRPSPLAGGRINARHAFLALELIAEAQAACPELVVDLGPLPDWFEELSGAVPVRFCFLELEGELLPVAAHGQKKLALLEAQALADQARRLLAKGAEGAPVGGDCRSALVASEGQGWAVVFEEPFLALLRFETEQTQSAILSSIRQAA
ncbi:MAG: hypothetical protein U0002_11590 [Thermoanaerobaculia bacterium]